jgi:tyrosine-protein kinase Etk/Wzc
VEIVAGENNVIAVTSATAGEGKSAVTANVAYAIAAMGQEVVAVDTDLRRPTLHEYFHIRPGIGVADVPLGVDIRQLAQPTSLPQLRVIAAGYATQHPTSILHGAVPKILEAFPEAMLVIDMPPVLATADAVLVATMAKSVVLVTDARHGDPAELERCCWSRPRAGETMLGVVLNRTPVGQLGRAEVYLRTLHGGSQGQAEDHVESVVRRRARKGRQLRRLSRRASLGRRQPRPTGASSRWTARQPRGGRGEPDCPHPQAMPETSAAAHLLRGDVVVVSPHLDDAALSLGAAIAAATRAGSRVTVLTVFGGDPNSTEPAGVWDSTYGFSSAADAARGRQTEDTRACELLVATPVWLTFGDMQYGSGADDDGIWRAIDPHLTGRDLVLIPGFPLEHPDHPGFLTRLILQRPLATSPSRSTSSALRQPVRHGRGFTPGPLLTAARVASANTRRAEAPGPGCIRHLDLG